MSFDLLIEDPSVGRPCVEQSPYFLRRVVANINVCNVAEVHVVVEVEAQATASLLAVFVEFTFILGAVLD